VSCGEPGSLVGAVLAVLDPGEGLTVFDNPLTSTVIRRVLRLAPALAVFWLLLSGHYTGLLLAFGALSVALVVWLVLRMAAVDGTDVRVRFRPRTPRYLGWLTGQVVASSWAVLAQVWSRRLTPCPAVGTTPTDDLSENATVAYANSITLTPGTLSLQVDEAGIEVHALTQSGLDELRAGGMLERLQRLEAR
jgi:multicomponent Na+:H+ antiporter subunit E